MDKKQKDSLAELGIKLTDEKEKIIDNYMRIFLTKNSHLNLISKNDEKFLFEKHVFDSLAINKFLTKRDDLLPLHLRDSADKTVEYRFGEVVKEGGTTSLTTLLDIGTGGGFPSVPIAIFYDDLQVYAVDSIKKKINAIEEITSELGLKNIFPICDRAENLNENFDFITTRAVSNLDTILKYAIPKLKDGGYFIAYKSKKSQEEISDAKKTIKKFGVKIIDTIEYFLPLDEVYERNLIIFKK